MNDISISLHIKGKEVELPVGRMLCETYSNRGKCIVIKGKQEGSMIYGISIGPKLFFN